MNLRIVFILILISSGYTYSQENGNDLYLVYINDVTLQHLSADSTFIQGVIIRNKTDLDIFKNISYRLDTALEVIGMVKLKKKYALFHFIFDLQLEKQKDYKWEYLKNKTDISFVHNDSTFTAKIVTDNIVKRNDFGSRNPFLILVPIKPNRSIFKVEDQWELEYGNKVQGTQILNIYKSVNKGYQDINETFIGKGHNSSRNNGMRFVSWKRLNLSIKHGSIYNVIEKISSSTYTLEEYNSYLHPKIPIMAQVTATKQNPVNLDSISNFLEGYWTTTSTKVLHRREDNPTLPNYTFDFKNNSNQSEEKKFEMVIKKGNDIQQYKGTWELGRNGRNMKLTTTNYDRYIFTITFINKQSLLLNTFVEIDYGSFLEEGYFDYYFLEIERKK